MTRSSIFVGAAVAVAATAACSTGAVAQEPTAAQTSNAHASRAELEARLQMLEERAASETHADSARERARRTVRRIRTRLRNGDFQVGDRILLEVEGEDALSDTLRVAPGRLLVVQDIGEIPLEGVLRSELEDHLTTELGRFIKDPAVRARPLIRLAVAGEVEQPGFYVVSAEALLSDVLMVAGGATQAAALDAIQVERGDRRVRDGAAIREAMVRGRTIAQLDLRAGDRIVVPERGDAMRGSELLRLLLTSVPALALVVSRLF